MNMLLTGAAQGDQRDLSAVMAALDAHAIVTITDAAGVIEYVNDKFCRVSGYSRQELLGQTHRVVKSGKHPPEFYAEMWRTISSGRIWQGAIENRKKSGEHYWVETTIMPLLPARGIPYRYVSIRTEITALRRLEERAGRQRLLLELVHAGTTQFMASADLAHAAEYILKGLIELTNSEIGFTGEFVVEERGARFKLHAVSELAPRAGPPAEGLGRGLDAASLDALCEKVTGAGRAVVAARASGAELPPAVDSFLGVPVFDGSELVGMYGLANREGGYDPDIVAFLGPFNTTYGVMIRAHRMAEREHVALAESRASREEAERANLAKSDFLSSMSHELRTPLNVIAGFSQILALDDLAPEQTGNVREIVKACVHLQRLIDDVLDLAKIESGHLSLSPEPVALQEELEQIVRLMLPMAVMRGVGLAMGEMARGAAVRADRVRLRQSVLNLVSNAIKYNREGGSVSMACLPSPERKFRILVSDTGIGIPSERRNELFLPFHRLVDAQSGVEGTGIGLVITRRLVEAMGGTVGLESRPGVGSTFWIELPACEPLRAAEIGAVWRGAAEAAGAKPRTVLYIEDNPANLRLIEQLIQRRPDLRMLSAHEPHLGIELSLAHLPDVILLDINLPTLGGYEVLHRLKASHVTAGIPVIAITANAMQRDIERGRKAGFRAYLTKPLDVRLFYAVLDEVLANGKG